ncbi:MAG TPA: Gfo/Idh/MocA family oxidoreductase [Firmicutes bacterium]|nr:Gfo/Idh/MocA family oxidoreductase [Bacillota bacterium]
MMRVGVMGLSEGHISGMLNSALAADNVQVVGVVEDNDEIYEKMGKSRNIPRYPTLDDLLEQAKPQLILEGLNHAQKVELVEKAAAAGAHVLLDKPLCSNEEHYRRIVAAVERSGIQLSMWFSSRSYPPFMALRERIQAGDLGELVSLVSTHPHRLSPKHPAWYEDKNIYAGTFHDLACHGVDQIRWLTGAEYTGVHAVAAQRKRHLDKPTLDDHVQASFTLSNGACAMLTADWLTPFTCPSWGDTRVIIMGTKGSAHLRAYAGNHVLLVSEDKGVEELELPEGRGREFVQNLVNSLLSGTEPFVSTKDVLAVAKACLAAEESARRGGEFLKI